jgi:hypothetical protein
MIVAALHSLSAAIVMIVFFTVYQQAENHWLSIKATAERKIHEDDPPRVSGPPRPSIRRGPSTPAPRLPTACGTPP